VLVSSNQQASDNRRVESYSAGNFVDGSMALAPANGGPDPAFRFDFAADRANDEEEARSKASAYRTTIMLVLALIVIGAGYWQRNNIAALFTLVQSMVAGEISWRGDDAAVTMSHQETTPPESRVRRRVHGAQPSVHARANSQPAISDLTPGKLPLGVKVRGQHFGKAPVVTATDGIYHNGAVEVGISDPWITNARLSPMAVEISPRESLALLIKRVPPVYPEAALRANLQGSVVLKVLIRSDGNVDDLRALSGDPLLVPAAIDSVRQWVYKPYYRDGVPTAVETVVVVEFSLASQTASALVQ
jgi:TonB family protein